MFLSEDFILEKWMKIFPTILERSIREIPEHVGSNTIVLLLLYFTLERWIILSQPSSRIQIELFETSAIKISLLNQWELLNILQNWIENSEICSNRDFEISLRFSLYLLTLFPSSWITNRSRREARSIFLLSGGQTWTRRFGHRTIFLRAQVKKTTESPYKYSSANLNS